MFTHNQTSHSIGKRKRHTTRKSHSKSSHKKKRSDEPSGDWLIGDLTTIFQSNSVFFFFFFGLDDAQHHDFVLLVRFVFRSFLHFHCMCLTQHSVFFRYFAWTMASTKRLRPMGITTLFALKTTREQQKKMLSFVSELLVCVAVKIHSRY